MTAEKSIKQREEYIMKKADVIKWFEMTDGTAIKSLNLNINDTIKVKPFKDDVVVVGFTKTGTKIKNVFSKQVFTIPNETKVIKTETYYHGIHF